MGWEQLTRRRFLQLAAGVGAVTAMPGLRSAAFGADGHDGEGRGMWLAGDFHVHTTYSHDVWGGPGDDNTDTQDAYTFGFTPAEQILNATTRGLDFVALTDHNRTDALFDSGYASDRLILVPGYEHSLDGPGQHCGVFLPRKSDLQALFLSKLATGQEKQLPFVDDDGFLAFARAIHEAGGMCVINHPSNTIWQRGIAATTQADGIEVWNTTFLSRTDTTGRLSSNVAADNHRSVNWWETNFLGDGKRKAAVGGSDNHWRSTFAAQGVGQPTTWVFAQNRSARDVIRGVQAGRTFVSAQPPAFGGARVFLSAKERWRGGRNMPAIVGGTVRGLGPLDVTVQVEGGEGNWLRLIAGSPATGGQIVHTEQVGSPTSVSTVPLVLDRGGWLRAELYVDPGYAMTAVTSPIYADPVSVATTNAQPTTGLPVTYGSDLTVPSHAALEHSC
jgi:predicted metal-dependent phosphoesterase TrpH